MWEGFFNDKVTLTLKSFGEFTSTLKGKQQAHWWQLLTIS